MKKVKSFLFPTLKKVFIAAFLFYSFGWIIWPSIVASLMTDWYPSGFPLAIHAIGLCIDICLEFSWLALIVDIIFWYLISATIVRAKTSAWRLLAYFVITIFGLWLVAFIMTLFSISLIF